MYVNINFVSVLYLLTMCINKNINPLLKKIVHPNLFITIYVARALPRPNKFFFNVKKVIG